MSNLETNLLAAAQSINPFYTLRDVENLFEQLLSNESWRLTTFVEGMSAILAPEQHYYAVEYLLKSLYGVDLGYFIYDQLSETLVRLDIPYQTLNDLSLFYKTRDSRLSSYPNLLMYDWHVKDRLTHNFTKPKQIIEVLKEINYVTQVSDLDNFYYNLTKMLSCSLLGLSVIY